jgi:hypothetical protein
MKNILTALFVIVVLALSVGESNAQWRANLYGGYGFDDNIEVRTDNGAYFSGDIKGTAFWGGGIEYVLQRNYGIELLYMREDADVDIKYTYNANLSDTVINPGLGSNFIMLAGNGYTQIPKSPLELFGTIMLGMAIFENKDPLPSATETSTTKFAYGFRAGTNIWFSNSVGIKIMGQLLSAAQAFGSGFYVGTGGVSAGVNPESSMLQFGVGGGLTFKFGATGTKRMKAPRM